MPFQRPEIVRPPSEANSYFLPLTAGCSNNACTFCGNYGAKLHIHEADEVKKEIDAVALYLSQNLAVTGVPRIVYAIASRWDGERVFLQDSDALVYPYADLVGIMEHLRNKLPSVKRVAAYATTQDILRLSAAELRRLRELNLGILYLGLESGDNAVLQHICKGVTAAQEIEAAQRAKAAGILTSVTVILGLGGKAGSKQHALETAKVLSAMDPDYVGALTLTLVPGTPLYDEGKKGEFQMLTPFESLGELLVMIKNSHFTHCFFSSMHASNYVSVRANLPEDKDEIVRQLSDFTKKGDPALLRPEFLRGL
ncbi:MAG: radical SAM protein [Dehalococcoidales bacterium]|nr:radical SAM protein [Dehalococcoidales bacterium]